MLTQIAHAGEGKQDIGSFLIADASKKIRQDVKPDRNVRMKISVTRERHRGLQEVTKAS